MKVEVPISVDTPDKGGRQTLLITVPNVREHDTVEATHRKALEIAAQMGYTGVRLFLMDGLSKDIIEKAKEKYGVSLDAESVVDAVRDLKLSGGDRIVYHGDDEYTLFISSDQTTIFVAKDILAVFEQPVPRS